MSYRKHPTKGVNEWYIVISQGSKNRPKYIPFTGTEDEVALEDKRMNAMIKGQRLTVEPTIDGSYTDYLKYYKTVSQPRTVVDLMSVMKRCILPHFGKFAARQVVRPIVQRYIESRLDTGVSHRTVEKELHYFSGMLKWMFENGLSTVKVDLLTPPKNKCKPQKIMMPLTLEELNAFIEQLPKDRQCLALLMSDIGLRCQEALRMRCEDIDLTGGRVFVIGKGNKRLMYPIITKRLFEALEREKAGRTIGWLVVDPKTAKTKCEPYKSLKSQFCTAAKHAGIKKPVTHHVLRHTFSTLIMELEIPAESRRILMRHSSLATTEHYTHTSPEWLEKQAGRFTELIDNLENVVKPIMEEKKEEAAKEDGKKRPSWLRVIK